MHLLFKVFLFAHIATGGTALLAGLISMVSEKGKKVHRLAGKIFFGGMAGVFVTSLYMSLAKNNWFLLCIGFFSFYLTCSGYIILKAKSEKQAAKVHLLHSIICVGGFLAGVAMIGIAIMLFSLGSMFGTVPAVFGLISITLSFRDYRVMNGKVDLKQVWLRSHAFRMAAAFAATLTAFVVVNIQIEQQWILWLLPAFIVLPITKRILLKYNVS
ncbi:MAG: DUF2306 domain-containing protein [Cyclobacteriaceae bacterium]|jgi:uncharacterized membrane protein